MGAEKKVFQGILNFFFTFKDLFNCLIASTSRSWIRNPWGKVMEKVDLDVNIFAQKWSKIAAAKRVFLTDFFPFIHSF